jgi:hypothetical protein
VLEPGVLYVSEEFKTAAHLCACGCGSKVRTPLGPTEWALEETRGGPTLWPSIGNWQKPCRSHYCIVAGHIEWAGDWSEAQVLEGRHREGLRRKEYFDALYRQRAAERRSVWQRIAEAFDSFWKWLTRSSD